MKKNIVKKAVVKKSAQKSVKAAASNAPAKKKAKKAPKVKPTPSVFDKPELEAENEAMSPGWEGVVIVGPEAANYKAAPKFPKTAAKGEQIGVDSKGNPVCVGDIVDHTVKSELKAGVVLGVKGLYYQGEPAAYVQYEGMNSGYLNRFSRMIVKSAKKSKVNATDSVH